MARVNRDYIDSVSTDELLRRAAAGFVKELDDPRSCARAYRGTASASG